MERAWTIHTAPSNGRNLALMTQTPPTSSVPSPEGPTRDPKQVSQRTAEPTGAPTPHPAPLAYSPNLRPHAVPGS